jgi:beta-glucosidase
MIGDSITQGWENEGKAVWEKYYAKRNAVNLGYGGDRTENVLWRLQHGEVDGISPKVAVLMIGTNNTGHRMEKPQYTAIGIRTILDELRTRLPETKILLLGVFPRDELPDTPMRKINNEINRMIVDYADDQHIFFLDIGREFLDADGKLSREVMPDVLHLNEASYATWANAMEPALQELFGE